MVMNYRAAKAMYNVGRKYKPIGTKFTKNIWLTYDPVADCFEFSYIHSKYYDFVNEQGVACSKRAGSSERDKYTMRAFARVYQDRAHLYHPADNQNISQIAALFFEGQFGLLSRRSPSIKEKGFQWTRFDPKASRWDRVHGKGDVFISGSGVIVHNDGTVEVESQPLVRVFNKDEQKALNGHIKAIRRTIGLRAKLGGFNSVEWGKVDQNLQREYGQRGMYAARNAELVNKAIMCVDDEDYTSMIPVLWMAICRESGYHRNVGDHDSRDLLTMFNRLIDANREGLRKQNGTVEYVSNESLSQP